MAARLLLLGLAAVAQALKYDPAFEDYNLNQNKEATDPIDYWNEPDFDHTPSPKDWRFPFYTLFLDRWVNGDPANDDINGTVYEKDIYSNQLRHGGDTKGLIDSLDYIKGMGMKVSAVQPPGLGEAC